MSHAVRLYAALRRSLASPPARRVGEAVRVPIDGRICNAKLRKGGKRCTSMRYRCSRERGPVCVSCGRGWPTKVVVESVRAVRSRIPQERERDLAADIGVLIANLPTWPRRVLMAWSLRCEICGRRVLHERGRWRHYEVAEHLARHFPRAGEMTQPRRISEHYERACENVDGSYAVLERAYGRASV